MNEEKELKQIASVPDQHVHVETDQTIAAENAKKEAVEGAAPSEDETEVNPGDSKLTRSE